MTLQKAPFRSINFSTSSNSIPDKRSKSSIITYIVLPIFEIASQIRFLSSSTLKDSKASVSLLNSPSPSTNFKARIYLVIVPDMLVWYFPMASEKTSKKSSCILSDLVELRG